MYPKSIVFIVVLLITMPAGPSQAQQGDGRGAVAGEACVLAADLTVFEARIDDLAEAGLDLGIARSSGRVA